MKRAWILIVAMLLLVSDNLSGSVALRLSNREMAEQADEIVIGSVKEIDYIFEERTKTPYTITTIEVERWIKGGSKEKLIKIRQIGGRLKDQQIFVTGDARLVKGERVLLFLKKGEEYRFLLALSQAKFSIIRDEKNGEERVIRDTTNLSLGRFNEKGEFVILPPLEEKPILLKDFIKEIETYIKK